MPARAGRRPVAGAPAGRTSSVASAGTDRRRPAGPGLLPTGGPAVLRPGRRRPPGHPGRPAAARRAADGARRQRPPTPAVTCRPERSPDPAGHGRIRTGASDYLLAASDPGTWGNAPDDPRWPFDDASGSRRSARSTRALVVRGRAGAAAGTRCSGCAAWSLPPAGSLHWVDIRQSADGPTGQASPAGGCRHRRCRTSACDVDDVPVISRNPGGRRHDPGLRPGRAAHRPWPQPAPSALARSVLARQVRAGASGRRMDRPDPARIALLPALPPSSRSAAGVDRWAAIDRRELLRRRSGRMPTRSTSERPTAASSGSGGSTKSACCASPTWPGRGSPRRNRPRQRSRPAHAVRCFWPRRPARPAVRDFVRPVDAAGPDATPASWHELVAAAARLVEVGRCGARFVALLDVPEVCRRPDPRLACRLRQQLRRRLPPLARRCRHCGRRAPAIAGRAAVGVRRGHHRGPRTAARAAVGSGERDRRGGGRPPRPGHRRRCTTAPPAGHQRLPRRAGRFPADRGADPVHATLTTGS